MGRFEKKLANSLTDFINQKKTQEQCMSFIDGYNKALEDTSAVEMLETLELVVMDLEERGRAYGDAYTMAKAIVEKHKEVESYAERNKEKEIGGE